MDTNDGVVVERARAGDEDAFRLLVERHSPAVFRLAFRMMGNEQDAEDVVQETFLRAHRRLGQFESRAGVGTWLHRIGVNCALDAIRLRQRHDTGREPLETVNAGGPEPAVSTDPLPDRALFGAEVRERVAAALETLSPKERAAFVLRHFEGQPIEEIARAMGLRNEAAKNNVFRAVQKLRRLLAPLVSATR